VEWVQNMAENGFSMIILSNNSGTRVESFAGQFPIRFMHRAKKPLPFGFRRAARLLGVLPKQVAVIGDQLFTDILGAGLSGMRSVLVEPVRIETQRFLAFKRKMEKPILRRLERTKSL